jgi:hypothetical protein
MLFECRIHVCQLLQVVLVGVQMRNSPLVHAVANCEVSSVGVYLVMYYIKQFDAFMLACAVKNGSRKRPVKLKIHSLDLKSDQQLQSVLYPGHLEKTTVTSTDLSILIDTCL